jgi:hypothetical protein
MSGDPRNVCQHREWTDRKIDTDEDGDAVRRDVEHFDLGDLQLTMSQYSDIINKLSEVAGKVDGVKNDTKTTADELFHFPEVDPAVMPKTGQRKQQFWGVMAVGKELPDLLGRFEEKLDEIDKRLAAIEAKTE